MPTRCKYQVSRLDDIGINIKKGFKNSQFFSIMYERSMNKKMKKLL